MPLESFNGKRWQEKRGAGPKKEGETGILIFFQKWHGLYKKKKPFVFSVMAIIYIKMVRHHLIISDSHELIKDDLCSYSLFGALIHSTDGSPRRYSHL